MLWLETRLARLALHGALLPRLFLLAFTLVIILPGFFALPPVDRDETRFAQASRQMVESGDYVDIRLGEETRYKKPVGIYWLQSAALTLVGAEEHAQDIWAYRLPSALAALCSVLLTYGIARRLIGSEGALLAGAVLAVGFVFGAEARLAKTDATLLACLLLSQWALARLWVGEGLSRGAAALFWLGLALSILVKGPMGLMVVGSTLIVLIALRRDLRWLADLRPLPGLVILAAVVLPWFLAITLRAGEAFWQEALGKDLLAKVGQGQESHGAPPGSYLLAVWITFWPGAMLLPLAGLMVWRGWRSLAVVFCLAWLVPSWLVFELTATKLVHYVLPTYPALAILCAAGWLAHLERAPQAGWRRPTLLALLALGAVFPLAGAYAALRFGGGLSLHWGLGLGLFGCGAFVIWQSLAARARLAPLLGFGLLSLGMSLSVFATLARVPQVWPSVALAEAIETSPCAAPQVIVLGYEEASLRLLSPVPITFSADLAKSLMDQDSARCMLILAEDATETQLGSEFEQITRVEGFSIGSAKTLGFTLSLRRASGG